MPELSTVLDDTAFPIYPTGGAIRSLSSRLADGGVMVSEMQGFVGDGVTDDSDRLDAAVAKALADGKGCVLLPNGPDIAHSRTLFLGYAADPTNAGYSLSLIKLGASANHNAQGGVLKPLAAGITAVKVGPGQDMMVHGVGIRWDSIEGGYRALQNANSVSFSVAAESGGCSKFEFRNCHSFGGYTMFKVGVGAGALADSGLFDACSGDNIVFGYDLANSQVYIQTIIGNRIAAKQILRASLGHNTTVVGGNWSGNSSRAKKLTIANVSAVTATANGNAFNYSFTAEVVVPDADLESGVIYDDAVIDDVQFGLIPLTITAYNAGTNIISLQIWPPWSKYHGQSTNLVSGSNLQTRIQAATVLGVGERLTTFYGSAINQVGTVHLENASGYTRFLDGSAGFDGGTAISKFQNVHCNYDPILPFDSDPDSQIIKRKLQRSHPFIYLNNSGVEIENIRLSQVATDGSSMIIDSPGARVMRFRNIVNGIAPNVRSYVGQDPFTGSFPASGLGDGEWYPNPFVPITANSSDARSRQTGSNKTEHWGWLPAFDRSPRLTPAELTTVTGVLPTFVTAGNVLYPLLCGGQNYSVGSPVAANGAAAMSIRSDHKFYSYGQDLTTTNITGLAWSFYGKTRKLVVNTQAFERLFPGLGIFLSHASINGGTPFECVVTGINMADGYVEVSALSGWLLPGTAGTQYSGTTIGQAAYNI